MQAWQNINSQLGQATVVETGPGGPITYRIDQREVGYLLSWREVWARSYAQWLALRSRYAAPKDGVKKWRLYAHPSTRNRHWADNDFEPIAKAIDDVFQSIGWRV